MPSSRIYLDYAATTPVSQSVAKAMQPWLSIDNIDSQVFGNPSSLHQEGQKAKTALAAARNRTAEVLAVPSSSLTFTSSGTEANNTVIIGLAELYQKRHPDRKPHLIISAIEHPAVTQPARYLQNRGIELTILPVDSEGFVHPETLMQYIKPNTYLVSIMHGNNEIGTLQPLKDLIAIAHKSGVPFHTDAVQTLGKVPIDLTSWGVDYLTFSGHKLYGPKGIGGFYTRTGAEIPLRLIHGGGQESGLRAGTENISGIVGLAQALSDCFEQQATEQKRLQTLQYSLWEQIQASHMVQESDFTVSLNGPSDMTRRVPGNVHFSITPKPGSGLSPIDGEAWVLQLDMAGVAVSSGSACHSAVIEPSSVVLALGKSVEAARATIRVSMGRHTTQAEIDRFVNTLEKLLSQRSRSFHKQNTSQALASY
ncbi:MAG: cysteine desulfurase [Cyanobacteria bacterium]|nr:cysteine desulfurase [Cyanobacteriota bacterium]